MKKKLFGIFFCGMLVLSCSNSTKLNYIDINKVDKVSCFELFESIDVVQLETNDQSLISTINRVIFYNDRYFVLDTKMQSVFCYDKYGKFQFKIAQKGQGSREYIYIEEFNIDKYNNQILLLEPFGNLFIFDMNGQFIEKVKLPKEFIAYSEVYPLDKNILVFISVDKYQVIFYSRKENKIIDRKYPIIDGVHNDFFSPAYKTYIYNDSIFFQKPGSNEIINILNNNIFTWNFGENNNKKGQIDIIRKDMKNHNRPSHTDYFAEGLLKYDILGSYESERYKIAILYFGDKKFKHLFWDKKMNKAAVFEKMDEGIQFIWPNFSGESIIVTYPSIIKFTSYNLDILSNEQKKIMNIHNSEMDNPIIIKYNFKK